MSKTSLSPPKGFSHDRSKAAPLLQFFIFVSLISYVAFVVPLFVPNLSFLWCLGRAVLRNCVIFWVSSLKCLRAMSVGTIEYSS